MNIVGHDQRMRLAVLALAPKAEQALFFHQPMDKIPVGFALTAVRARGQRFRQRKLILPTSLRMHIEYVSDDAVDAIVLPVPHVAPEFEEVHPWRDDKLIAGKAAVTAQPARRVDITVDWQIRLVRLLNPQRHRLSDQRLEFDVARRGYHVERDAEVATELGTGHDPARDERIVRQRRYVRLEQSILLDQATTNCLS